VLREEHQPACGHLPIGPGGNDIRASTQNGVIVLCDIQNYVKLDLSSARFPLIFAAFTPFSAEFTAHNFML
jgi:hypothetical protein